MTGQQIMFDMRMQIYGHLQRLDVQYYDRNPVGRLMTRVTTDVDVLNELFTAGVVSVFGDIFLLIGIMTALAIMDWRLAAIAFTVLPLIALVTQWFRRNVRESYRSVRTWIARINAFLQEHITGMSTVQLFRSERRSFEAFDTVNRGHRDANVDSIYYYAVFYPAIEVIGALSTAHDHLVRRTLGGRGHALARFVPGLPAVLAALLSADQRPLGEIQHPPGRDGVERADLQAARYGGEN